MSGSSVVPEGLEKHVVKLARTTERDAVLKATEIAIENASSPRQRRALLSE